MHTVGPTRQSKMRTLTFVIFLGLLATTAPAQVLVHVEAEKNPNVAVLIVEIANSGDERVDIQGIGVVELGDTTGRFWFAAPFDLEQFGPIGPNKTSHLQLTSRERRTVHIDLGALRWGKMIYSVWPNQNLSKVVPRGTYVARVTISRRDRSTIMSNVIDLNLTRERLKSGPTRACS
jgi:hypothetical protein